MKIEYREKSHRSLPHVICTSGGRTSGYMLLKLIEAGQLDADRGDVALFNNTSAEHPETYRFLQKLTKEVEASGIPFYWTQWCSYESYKEGDGAKRNRSYKLVKPVPIEDDPDGYEHRGEVFEEMISLIGIIPGRQQRICTYHLKAQPSYGFIDDWLKPDTSIQRYGPVYNETRMSVDRWVELNRRYRGTRSEETIKRYKEFITGRPIVRPAQSFEIFSSKKRHTDHLGDDFVSLVGIRADETKRAQRVLAQGKDNWAIAYCPLNDAGIKKTDILDWWKGREYDLGIPSEMSNCVWCFLKSTNTLKVVGQHDPLDRSPASVNWWIDIEEKYMKHYERESLGQIDDMGYGFFGPFMKSDPNKSTYRTIQSQYLPEDIPCMCLD